MRRTIIVDFDGVLNSYASGWEGADVINDPPIPGAIEFLHRAIQEFDIAIVSTRSHQKGGKAAMQAWLKENSGVLWYTEADYRGLEQVTFPDIKPPAIMTIDDRAWRFEGTFPTVEQIKNTKPWWKVRGE